MSLATTSPDFRRTEISPGAAASLEDARPIIPRNQTNLWTQAETVRNDLYRQFDNACRAHGVVPLLLGSGPYAFPSWVKFEAWQPQEVNETTLRSFRISAGGLQVGEVLQGFQGILSGVPELLDQRDRRNGDLSA